MPQELINGINVDFPHEPYEIQKKFMHCVIEALNTKRHAVLESPTGTGKTLSLLCSSLSWLKHRVNASAAYTQSDPKEANYWGSGQKVRIYYTSRTHSQLSKVMTELKSTKFKDIKVTILGSRDQMCIHPTVSKETNLSVKNLLCKLLSKSKSCYFGNRVETCKSHPSLNEVVDIEDLVTKTKKISCCPYYAARDMQENADVIFLPYNYLFDPNIRSSLSISLYNSVIVLDEAHNINKVCEEAASVSLLSSDVALALTEVTQEMQAIHGEEQNSCEFYVERDYDNNELCMVKETLLKLEKSIDNLEFQGSSGSATHIGSYVFKIFKIADIDENSYKYLVSVLNKIVDALSNIEFGGGRKGNGLKKLAEIISVIFSVTNSDKSVADKYFKVYVESAAVTKTPPLNSWDSLNPNANKNAKKINFWCFNAGYGMSNLLNEGVHSMILTSGTLAPLAATIRELNLVDPITLESPHIIARDQVLVRVINKGPTGVELRSSFMNRDNAQYWNEIGLCLQNYLRVIPDGVLVFFPSYNTLNKAVDHWKSSGLWEKLASIKPILIETSRKNEFNGVITEYNRAISEGNGRGAVLLGVCRGKVSEGLDFINEYGRAVIICGLPYPPLLDPKIKLKKEYLDHTNRTIKLMSGDLWYQLEATRAVNQAIGRVIRHSRDFGAILLCDVKFSQKNVIDNLSKWLQPLVRNETFGFSVALLKQFFNANWGKAPFSKYRAAQPEPFKGDVSMVVSVPSTSREERVHFTDVRQTPKYPGVSVKKSDYEKESTSSSSVINLLCKDDEDEAFEVNPAMMNRPETSAEECSILGDLSECPSIHPAKKRKIRMKPLVFEDYSSTSSNEATIAHYKRLNDAKNFLCEMKTTLEPDSYYTFSKIMKQFHRDSDFDTMINKLTSLFPPSDPSFREIFFDCKKLLTGEYLKKFDDFTEQYNSSSC